MLQLKKKKEEEKFSREKEVKKRNQMEILGLKDTMNEMKNEIENINGRMNQAEEKNL